MPPCCWPSTMTGLRIRPQSSTATCRSGTTRPVSVSTSTTETCAPNGNVAPSWGTSSWACSGVSRSAAAAARAGQSTTAPGTPETVNPASVSSRSSGAASSSSAASSRAWSRTAAAAAATALPPSCSDREPPVPPPRGHRAGVGLHVADLLDRDAEPVGHDHRERRGVALAVRGRPGHHRGRAVRLDPDAAELLAAEAGDLDVRRDADAEQLLLAGLDPAGLLGAQRVHVGHPQRLLQRGLVVADVVGQPGAGLVGERVLGDQVAAPDLLGGEPELVPPPGPSAAPASRPPRAARRRGRRRSARCWSSPRWRSSRSSGSRRGPGP